MYKPKQDKSRKRKYKKSVLGMIREMLVTLKTFIFFNFIYLFLREGERLRQRHRQKEGGAERERERESQADLRC